MFATVVLVGPPGDGDFLPDGVSQEVAGEQISVAHHAFESLFGVFEARAGECFGHLGVEDDSHRLGSVVERCDDAHVEFWRLVDWPMDGTLVLVVEDASAVLFWAAVDDPRPLSGNVDDRSFEGRLEADWLFEEFGLTGGDELSRDERVSVVVHVFVADDAVEAVGLTFFDDWGAIGVRKRDELPGAAFVSDETDLFDRVAAWLPQLDDLGFDRIPLIVATDGVDALGELRGGFVEVVVVSDGPDGFLEAEAVLEKGFDVFTDLGFRDVCVSVVCDLCKVLNGCFGTHCCKDWNCDG